jgi:glycosyltransferase involved in cell wall biosynthesis
MQPKKILIVHDRLLFKGGAERLVVILANGLKADIMTEFWGEKTYDKNELENTIFVLDEGHPKRMVWRYFRAQWNFLTKTRKIFKNYDLIIFSGNNCLSARINVPRKTKTLLYCHTPPRHVYDLYEFHKQQETNWVKRLVLYTIGSQPMALIYRWGLRGMQTVITNSQTIKERLWRFCKRDSVVVYPPIDTEKYTWKSQGDYYLSFARLDPLKRVEDIVKAFKQMPEKKLMVCSGGDAEEEIKALAKDAPNITLAGWMSNEGLQQAIGNCIATIYIPRQEDFGMSVLEGMAAGKPCIGVAEGGLRETITPQTGILLSPDYTVTDIIKTAQALTPEKALSMREACEKQAGRFSSEVFLENIRAIIATL